MKINEVGTPLGTIIDVNKLLLAEFSEKIKNSAGNLTAGIIK